MIRSIIIAIYIFFPLLAIKADELQLFPVEDVKEKRRVLWLDCNHIIYFFTDDTIVYVRHPPYEYPSWGWDNIAHQQPDSQFYFQLVKWNNFSSFQLYRYCWNESAISHPLEPLFSSDKSASKYLYFIENIETKEKTLCQIWSLADLGAFIMRYGKECYKSGYNNRNN